MLAGTVQGFLYYFLQRIIGEPNLVSVFEGMNTCLWNELVSVGFPAG
jgi:hypothetical protein